MKSSQHTVNAAWSQAHSLCQRYLRQPAKIDLLADQSFALLCAEDRRRCQFLFWKVVREFSKLQWFIDRRVPKPPKIALRALLLLALAELLEANEASVPKIIHHAVAWAKQSLSLAEARLVNAVLRKAPAAFAALTQRNDQQALRFSHPDWLVQHWATSFPPEAVQQLLQWNQSVPPIYVRLMADSDQARLPASLVATSWPRFYRYEGSDWQEIAALLADHRVYVQDPATRIPVELLQGQPGEAVLDLCAAPGGKTRLLAEVLFPSGKAAASQLVAIDRPGWRFKRLQQNLAAFTRHNLACRAIDILQINQAWWQQQRLPHRFDAVLLDAPCSNTGVLRRRPDAKWRLSPQAIADIVVVQQRLLQQAAAWVKPGGRLCYSTCSIEAVENTQQIERFLAQQDNRFVCEQSAISYPWLAGHDGGAAFLLRRVG